jgi:acylphosphatase
VVTYLVIIRGVLRGFGIRGYIYEKMMMKKLSGFIEDLNLDEILVCVSGLENSVHEFIDELRNLALFAVINDVEVYEFEECLHNEEEGVSLIVKDFE